MRHTMPSLLATAIVFVLGTTLWNGCDAMNGLDFNFMTGYEYNQLPTASLISPPITDVSEAITKRFTMCFWLELHNTKTPDTTSLVSYFSGKTGNSNEILLEVNHKEEYTVLKVGGKNAIIPEVPPLGKWTHICVSWRSRTGVVLFYFNGKQVGEGRGAKDHDIGGDGFLVLGQDQDWKDGGYDAATGLRGKITGFQLFDTVLTEAEVSSVMECGLDGSVINWKESMWGLDRNVKVTDSDAPGCAQGPCPDDEKDTCNEHPVISSYDITDELNKDVPNVVRAVMTEPATIPNDLQDFSLCFWLFDNEKLSFAITPVAYLGEKDSKEIAFAFFRHKIYMSVGGKNKTLPKLLRKPNDWNHICVTHEGESGATFLYLEGQKAIENPLVINPGYVVPAEGTLYVQQDQMQTLDEEDPIAGFGLKVLDLNLWDTMLSDEEVDGVMKCSGKLRGSVINWNDAAFEIVT